MTFSKPFGNRGNDERFESVKVADLVVIAATEKAILVANREELEELRSKALKVWLPKSQIKSCTPALKDLEQGDAVEVWIPRWLAQEKGFLYEG